MFYLGGLEEAVMDTVSKDIHFQDLFKTSLKHDVRTYFFLEMRIFCLTFPTLILELFATKLENFLSWFSAQSNQSPFSVESFTYNSQSLVQACPVNGLLYSGKSEPT